MHKIIGSTLAAAIALTLTACIDDKDYVADVRLYQGALIFLRMDKFIIT